MLCSSGDKEAWSRPQRVLHSWVCVEGVAEDEAAQGRAVGEEERWDWVIMKAGLVGAGRQKSGVQRGGKKVLWDTMSHCVPERPSGLGAGAPN